MTTRDVYTSSVREDWYTHDDAFSPYGSLGWVNDEIDKQWLTAVDYSEETLSDDTGVSIFDSFSSENPTEVKAYIDKHEGLASILLEAGIELSKYFPRERFELKVVHDPEINDSSQLFIYVKTRLPVAEALANLDRFDTEWFLDTDTRSNHAFNVNLRFA